MKSDSKAENKRKINFQSTSLKQKITDHFFLKKIGNYTSLRRNLSVQVVFKLQQSKHQRTFPQYDMENKGKPYLPCFVDMTDVKSFEQQQKLKFYFQQQAERQEEKQKKQEEKKLRKMVKNKPGLRVVKNTKKNQKNGRIFDNQGVDLNSRKYIFKNLRAQNFESDSEQTIYQPMPKQKHCHICKQLFQEEYLIHINSQSHQLKARNSTGNIYMEKLLKQLQEEQKEFQYNKIHLQLKDFQNYCKMLVRFVKKRISKFEMLNRERHNMYMQAQEQLFHMPCNFKE